MLLRIPYGVPEVEVKDAIERGFCPKVGFRTHAYPFLGAVLTEGGDLCSANVHSAISVFQEVDELCLGGRWGNYSSELLMQCCAPLPFS